MLVAILKNYRTEIDGDLKDGLDAFVVRNRTTIRAVTESLVSWLLSQDHLVQLALLKGLELDDQLRKLVAERLKSAQPPTMGSVRAKAARRTTPRGDK